MARSFTPRDARELLQTHQTLADQLTQNCRCAGRRYKDCINAASALAADGLFADLVAEKLLAGIANDHLPAAFRPLIHRLYQYIQSKPVSEECSRMAEETRQRLSQETALLRPATNGLQWLFTSRPNKDKAEAAYDYLLEAATGAYAGQIRSGADALERLTKLPQEAAQKAFEQDRDTFRKALMQLELPQQACTVPALDRLLRYHCAVLDQLTAADNTMKEAREEIFSAADRLVAQEVLKLLQTIPVDDLGREKTGIRFKALKDAGYQTVADVYCATAYNLAAIYGISEDTAEALKHYARQYAEQAAPGVRIRLSADDRSHLATQLVTAICAYRRRSADCAALEALRQKHEKQVAGSVESLREVGTGIGWVFAQAQEKLRLIGLYRYLDALMQQDYTADIREPLERLQTPLHIDPAEAWDDFERSSIAYFNILETLLPGLLGSNDTWFGLPEELAREIQEECFFPDGLKCALRRYQEWGVKYILHQERVLLGDEMGLGKTVQAIAAMVSLRNTGATHFMVVCPASVVPNWCKEIAEKSKLRVTKIHGPGKEAAFRDWLKNGGVAVTNFETTAHLKMDEDFAYGMLIVDEAHYIKNAEANRTKNVLQLSLHTRRLLFMTGTALENNVDEMIALVRVLRPNIASKLQPIAFLSAAPQFREMIAPVYYRRRREDVLTELPELMEEKAWCTLSPEETEIYESSVLNEHYMSVRRVSWNVDDLKKSCKASRMLEIIDEVKEEGRKAIIFSFFRETIGKIHHYLGSACLQPITGSLSPQRRQEIIDEFDRAPAGTVLLSQIQAGGTGLNIQSASVVIMCEPQLKPSIENQAISRAYRMGQARNVLVYRLLCEDTIDERITEMLADKQAVFDEFADKSVSAEATAKEEVALDDKTMGKIIKEEIDRINAKNGAAVQPVP